MVQVVWILIQDKGDAREGCQMRLIDADALIKRFKALTIRSKDLTIDYKRGHSDGIVTAVEWVEEATTVDPAKRGRYIEAMSGAMHVYPNGQVMCSVCKQRMPLTWKKMPPYCFGCGAKMDGESNE